jgi:hypothetical protein
VSGRLKTKIAIAGMSAALVLPTALATSAHGVAPKAPTATGAQAAQAFVPTVAKRQKAKRAIKRSALAAGKRPKRMERSEPFVRQTACNHIPKPGVVQFQETLLKIFPRPAESLRTYNVLAQCAYPGSSEHSEGRALDFEADIDDQLQRTQANELLRWLTKKNGYHAKRWGIMYVVWNQRIWATYNMKWRTMRDRGSKTHNHRDHIHFSFTWNGALKRSSYWSGRTRATHYGPCQKYRGEFAAYSKRFQPRRCGSGRSTPSSWSGKTTTAIKPWDFGDRVTRLQAFLIDAGQLRGAPYGSFNLTTHKAVMRWQKKNGTGKTGIWDRESQRKSGNPIWPRSQTQISGWSTDHLVVPAGTITRDRIRVKTGGGYRSRTVQLQRKLTGTADWRIITSAATGSNGRYQAEFAAPVGDWRFRVVVSENSSAFGTTSPQRKVFAVEGVGPPDGMTSQSVSPQGHLAKPMQSKADPDLLPGQSLVTGAQTRSFG